MKNNKRTKINNWIATQLEEHGITYERNARELEKTIYYPESNIKQIPITIKTGYTRHEDKIVSKDNAVLDIENRIKKIIKVLDEVTYKYPEITLEELGECYANIKHPCATPNNILKELSTSVENTLLLKDIQLYENVKDYPDIFPKSRKRNRKIIAFLGETNSGKTYNAMSEIANSFTAAYLAPLRLLALETFEYLNNQNIKTSLITGEEKIIYEDATCTSSTVECFNPEKSYETIVIDEIQMMDDPDRGAFFIQALIGANADKVVVTGPPEYKERLESIAALLGEEIEVHIFKRKTQVKIIEPIDLSNVKKNTAIVTFSRKNIFEIRDKLPANIKSSVIYGALGYDVRKKQAEQFVNGETDVLITTDAIGMGLNLPIETILFTTDVKYDGKKVDKISQMLAKQIAGRAGRYKKFDIGYVSAINQDVLDYIKECIHYDLEVDANKMLGVRPTPDYIETMLVKYKLSTILSNWCNLKYPEGSRFYNIELIGQTKIAHYLEKHYPDEVKKYYRLVYCPVDYEKDYDIFEPLVDGVIKYNTVNHPEYNEKAPVNALELMIKKATLTLWFAQQFPEMCVGGYENFLISTFENMESLNNVLHKKLTVGKVKKQTKQKYNRRHNK